SEILTVAKGLGESTRSGTSLLGRGGSAAGAVGGVIDMTSSNFANTGIGEAVNEAASMLATELHTGAARIPVKTISVEGLVADVSGDTLILNVGTSAGVKVGDNLAVRRVG